MSRSDVITLVDDLALGVTNATEVGIFYDEVVRELGFTELLTSTEVKPMTVGQATVQFATDTIRSLELYTDRSGKLDRTTVNAVKAVYNNQWKSLSGTPIAYCQDQENDNTVRLVPAPDAPITITIIRVDSRLDVPVWLELPIALEVLSREMSRESAYQDVKFAVACARLARLLFDMLGIMLGPEEKKSA